MLEGLRETLKTIQDEIAEGVGTLKKYTVGGNDGDDIERLRYEAMESLVRSSAGGHLLLKYQSEIEKLRRESEETIRMADLCSTRMGRVQQECTEKAHAFIQLENFLRDSKGLNDALSSIEHQMEKLSRFCLQTEAAMTHLEALSMVLKSEAKVDEIRKRSGRLSRVISASPPPVAARSREVNDMQQGMQEEVMLEEFLSNP